MRNEVIVNGADGPEPGPQRLGAVTLGATGDSGGGDEIQGGTSGAPSSPPVIALPKGGGAIRGMGEKFSANPVTCTASLSVPVYTSPGRSGFDPQLSLLYDSHAGNGPFGFGWSLSLPAITRKTNMGLPIDQDPDEPDIFNLSGAEDLVPVGIEVCGQWQRESLPPRTLGGVNYEVQRYRPQIEGLFAKIERWTHLQSGETHWRSISKDNVTTLYGKTADSRIADPTDPTRILSWSICESYDDKGNAILYEYVPEDSSEVDPSWPHERHRTDESRSANRYLKRIKYGNRSPGRPGDDLTKRTDWLFEVVFDYGEHDSDKPTPNDKGRWLCRPDPFSVYRVGFEVRTYRLCQRVLMFHHFPDEEEVGKNCLVRSTDLVYRSVRNNYEDLRRGHPGTSFIASITQSGYKREPDGSYRKKSLPPLDFKYAQATVQEGIKEVDSETLKTLPHNPEGADLKWVDPDDEGLSKVFTEQTEEWFHNRGLCPRKVRHDGGEETAARFAPVDSVAQSSSLAGTRQQVLDLAGAGQVDLVQASLPEDHFSYSLRREILGSSDPRNCIAPSGQT